MRLKSFQSRNENCFIHAVQKLINYFIWCIVRVIWYFVFKSFINKPFISKNKDIRDINISRNINILEFYSIVFISTVKFYKKKNLYLILEKSCRRRLEHYLIQDDLIPYKIEVHVVSRGLWLEIALEHSVSHPI